MCVSYSACGNYHCSECTNIQHNVHESDLHDTDDNLHSTVFNRNDVGMPDFLWENDTDIQIENEEEV